MSTYKSRGSISEFRRQTCPPPVKKGLGTIYLEPYRLRDWWIFNPVSFKVHLILIFLNRSRDRLQDAKEIFSGRGVYF
jgi:hypothetical protein